MCFVLYLGTTRAVPRREFDKNSAGLSVKSLTNREAAIIRYFGSREVQCVGSSSDCGCDFPHAMFQNGGWPEIEFHKNEEKDEMDIARDAVHRQNCKALVELLRATGEREVELYGIWDGDFAKVP